MKGHATLLWGAALGLVGAEDAVVNVAGLKAAVAAACSAGLECPTNKLVADAVQAWCQDDNEQVCTLALLTGAVGQLTSGSPTASDLASSLAGITDKLAVHSVTGAQLKTYLGTNPSDLSVSRGLRFTTKDTTYVETQKPFGFCRSWNFVGDADTVVIGAPIGVLLSIDGAFNASAAAQTPVVDAVTHGLKAIFAGGDNSVDSIKAAQEAAASSTSRANPVAILEHNAQYYKSGSGCAAETNLQSCFAQDCRRCSGASGSAASAATDKTALAAGVAAAQQCDEAHFVYSGRLLGKVYPVNMFGGDCLDLSPGALQNDFWPCTGGQARRVALFKELRASYPNVFTATSGGAFFSGPLYKTLGAGGVMELLTSGGADGRFDSYGLEQADFFGVSTRALGKEQYAKAMRWLLANGTAVVASNVAFGGGIDSDVETQVQRVKLTANGAVAALHNVPEDIWTALIPEEFEIAPQATRAGFGAQVPLDLIEASRYAQETSPTQNRFVFMSSYDRDTEQKASVLPFLDVVFNGLASRGSPSSGGLALAGPSGGSLTNSVDKGAALRDRSRFHVYAGPVNSDAIGHVAVEKRGGSLWRTNVRKIVMTYTRVTDDAAMLATMQRLYDEVVAVMGKKVGTSTVDIEWDMYKCREGDCPANRLVTDAAYEWCQEESATLKAAGMTDVEGCDFSFNNGGAVRGFVEKGDLNAIKAQGVSPFGNPLFVKDITGSDLIAALENGLSGNREDGRWMTATGLRVAVNPNADGTHKLIDAFMFNRTAAAWEPVLPWKTYRYIANGYLMVGGDGYSQFAKGTPHPKFSEVIDYQVLADHLERLSPITAYPSIVDLQARCGAEMTTVAVGEEEYTQKLTDGAASATDPNQCYMVKTTTTEKSRTLSGVCGAGYAPDAVTGCTPCGAGTYQPIDDDADVECLPCDAGRYSLGGAARCTACEAGKWSEAGSATCTACSAGHYWDPVLGCAECRPGSFAAEAGSISCDLCEVGSFRGSNSSADACVQCGDRRTTQFRGSTDASACVCSEGYFEHDGECRACGGGFTCPLGSTKPTVLAGFWAAESVSGEYRALYCGRQTEHLCPGGALEQCANGRTGPACGLCASDMRRTSQGCEECSAGPVLPIIFFLVFILASAGAYRVTNDPMTREATTWLATSLAIGMLVSKVQMLGVVSSLALTWPAPLDSLMEVMKLFVFDLSVIQVNCLSGASPMAMYAPSALMIFLFPGILMVMFGLSHALQTVTKKAPWTKAKTWNTIGAMMQAGFITCCGVVMQPFICFPHPDGGTSVLLYPSLECGTSDQSGLAALALAAIFVILLPYCIVSMWALAVAPRKSSESQDFLAAFRYLFFRFRTDRYWWGAAVLTRNFALSLGPVLFPEDANACALFMATTLLLALTAQCHYWPWRTPTLNCVDAGVSKTLVIILLASGALAPQSTDTSGFVTVIVVMLVLAFLGVGLIALLGAKAMWTLGKAATIPNVNVRGKTQQELHDLILHASNAISSMGVEELAKHLGTLSYFDLVQLHDGAEVVQTTVQKSGEASSQSRSKRITLKTA